MSAERPPLDADGAADRAGIAVPPSAVPGRRTPTFSAATVPPGLLSAHTTTVWAELVVTAGSVEFHDEQPAWQVIATPGRPVVIVPQRPHHIAPAADAEFHVRFFDLPDQAGEGSTGRSDNQLPPSGAR